MGRPEPVVLFAQTILHSQLDEYVDEEMNYQPEAGKSSFSRFSEAGYHSIASQNLKIP
uniref:Uncharacterized protein n=1 Tax=Oryza sativa subsp. japonica TaxID=39947 RepID=Q7Y1M6_ORYSJ|nr:hypothetical protein [Oryza sativa Japonica Group]